MHVCKSLKKLHAAQPTSEDNLHKPSKVSLVLKHSSDFSAGSKDTGSRAEGMLMYSNNPCISTS